MEGLLALMLLTDARRPARFDVGDAGVPLTVPATVSPGPAQLRTTLAVTTVSGQVLQPQVRTAQVTVAPPLGFPTVTSKALSFGRLQGTTPGTATLAVTGPGCVWVTGGDLRSQTG